MRQCSYSAALCFNPRPSCEGRLFHLYDILLSSSFNPRPSCEGRQGEAYWANVGDYVSIHAPLARGDDDVGILLTLTCVSIHAPLARGDGVVNHEDIIQRVSIHAPLARGDITLIVFLSVSYVSIHAPLARGDRNIMLFSAQPTGFNPRPSCEGRPLRAVSIYLK